MRQDRLRGPNAWRAGDSKHPGSSRLRAALGSTGTRTGAGKFNKTEKIDCADSSGLSVDNSKVLDTSGQYRDSRHNAALP